MIRQSVSGLAKDDAPTNKARDRTQNRFPFSLIAR
jgi:hypothetical protein